jgi:hypothetical protein
MASRFDNRNIFANKNDMYYNKFRDRGVRKVVQYGTGILLPINEEIMSQLTIIEHIWTRGDHFYKLANQYYDNPSYWWIIAQFNQKPTEANISFGENILIPNPIETILSYYESEADSVNMSIGGY